MYLSFYKHQEFYKIVITDEGQNSLFDCVIYHLYSNNLKSFKKLFSHKSDCDIDYYAYKMATTQAMLLKKWMKDDMKISPKKMVEYFFMNIDD